MTVSGRTILNLAVFALSLALLGIALLWGPVALADTVGEAAGQVQTSWSSRLRHGLIPLAGLCAASSLLALLLNVRQNRVQCRALRLLRQGAQRIADGEFKERIQPTATAEFADLTTEFNQMAARLDVRCADLERQARARGGELALSERLASVGFLAGLVAHEINNPLNIITGYAELSLRQAEHPSDPQVSADMKQALQIILEEGFRCKCVTDKLLLLAKPSGRSREIVAITKLAEEVAGLTDSLARSRDCQVHVMLEPGDDLAIWGNQRELRQVALHLALNALDAVQPGTGEVILQGARHGQEIELRVVDNGRGMTQELLAHAFEPFFSDRRPAVETRLGLCVAQAVAQAHGGRITAESDGPGRGSRFTIRLPACPAAQLGDEKAA